MELSVFKKVFSEVLIGNGFSKKGSYFYFLGKEITLIIGLQKSNYSNGLYVNLGYIINILNPDFKNLRDVDGDIRARFGFEHNGKKTDFLELDQIETDKLKEILTDNLNQFVYPASSLEKLKIFLQEEPIHLYQTKITAKKLLGF